MTDFPHFGAGPERPYTILSCAVSVDGYIDDSGPERLRLSNEADFDEIDALRAECDAILVGAQTVRNDDPRLLVRSPQRQQERLTAGRPAHLRKVVLSASGDLDPAARLFAAGDTDTIVYVSSTAHPATTETLATVPGEVTVADAGEPLNVATAVADLARRGVGRLLVEGGGAVHTAFLTAGLADELRLAIAPFFVGEAAAPRFVHPGAFPHTAAHPMRLAQARTIGDIAVLRYLLKEDG
ncbi:RibD family protein [Salinactinospora qingdaonensis]|uniref:Bacterial bifunctional deaminase-reductase C-terminal domain-containing protein n=1 Tax=Salinactinospora qingdaonensis TaxID=702744 RepID=A0ABP7FZE3_9ACTN